MAAAGGGGAAAPSAESEFPKFDASDEAVLKACRPDAPETLGGWVEETEPDHPSVVMHMIRSLMPGQDLTRVTIPSWYLENRSLLEKFTDVMMHPEMALRVVEEKTPHDRMLQVIRWFLSAWHYKLSGIKKPYNPIIGETFACFWPHEDGTKTQYVAEQVLHRPPITALYIENRKRGIVCDGSIWTKSQFQAPQTAASLLVGNARLNLINLGELYHVTFPNYYAHNLLMGTIRTEVGGNSVVICEKSGLRADLEWHQKPMLWGQDEIARVTVKVSEIKGGKVLYEIDGHWDKVFEITDVASGKKSEFLDITKLKVAPKWVVPTELQNPWESRRLWAGVTEALMVRPEVDWDEVTRRKLRLEDDQRELACHKKGDKFKEWPTKFFDKVTVTDPDTGKDVETWRFRYERGDKYKEGEPEMNLIALSRRFADSRGGSPPALDAEGKPAAKKGDGKAAAGGGGGEESKAAEPKKEES